MFGDGQPVPELLLTACPLTLLVNLWVRDSSFDHRFRTQMPTTAFAQTFSPIAR